MMFSSNQLLEISGCIGHINELYTALEFALKFSGNLENFQKPNTKSRCVYQITNDGRYCIGWAYEQPANGWLEYQFEFDIGIISQIIHQFLDKHQDISRGEYDGSYHKGFVMRIIDETLASESNGIKQPFYGIVEFAPYTCFYSK